MDDLGDALEQAEIASGQFSDALDDAELAAEWGNKAVTALKAALTDLQNASTDASNAYQHVKKAMKALEKSLGDTEQTKAALKELVDATADMAAAFSKIAGAVSNIGTALDNVHQAAREDENWQDLRTGVDNLRSALVEISDALAQVSSALETIRVIFDNPENTPTNQELLKEAIHALKNASAQLEVAYQAFSDALAAFEDDPRDEDGETMANVRAGVNALATANNEIGTAVGNIITIIENVESDPRFELAMEQLATGLADLNAGLGHANEAIVQIDEALRAIENDPRYSETVAYIREQLVEINNALGGVTDENGNVVQVGIKDASQSISHALKVLEDNLDPDQVEKAWKQIQKAGKDLELAAEDLDKAVGNLQLALGYLEFAGGYGSDALTDLNKASMTMEKAISLMRQATEDAADVIEELAEMPAIQFTPIGSDLTERGDALDDALSDMLDQVDALNDTMSSLSDILLADLRAINRQVGVIIDLLKQAGEEAKEDEASDHFEDISDQELSDERTSGRISNARNMGTVEGDVNVAGIVGSMAIEYDFDPEDDLTEDGDRSLDFRYQTVAVVRDSVNKGTVTAKKNYAGGIVGRMDLGAAYLCQTYGSIESTNGDYVGGIAGRSCSAIRRCFAKCTLSGGSYVGGITGSGDEDSVIENCYTLVRITDYEQHAGAISGTEDGEFTGNCFVSDELAGLGRVSYAGKAEPISYQALSAVQELPDPFKSFTLTFKAEDAVLKTESFDFGDSFGEEVYPSIPEKEGHYAQWDIQTLNDLRFDTVVEAVYTTYITALASKETREDGRPVFYVEGNFQDGDMMETLALEEDPSGVDGLENLIFQKRKFAERWQVSFSEDGQDVHTLRYLRPDGDARLRIYMKQNGTWERVRGEKIGRYLAFDEEGTDLEIVVFTIAIGWWMWLLLALPLLALGFIGIRKIKKIRKRRKAAARLTAGAKDNESSISQKST